MSKRSKTASTQEISIELAEEAQDALLEVLQQTQWVELPFRDAAIHLEQECDRFFDSEYPEGFSFFAAQYFIQATDERRFGSPVVDLLGVLFAWETQIRDFGKEWFKERTSLLLELMRTLPPEQDRTLLALLHALDPSVHKIMSQLAKKGGEARAAKLYSEGKAAAIADWEANGHKYKSPRAFARNCKFKDYGVEDFMTVYLWILEHRRTKA
ncbi:hypothetical protein EGJ28_13490 [Stutzerimonas xanthomarina]|uniref:Uncharacterized protein n=1 Tax=Stutzerimonas xanthomarina TaxID=271420 RepID=A0A3R8V859_9GAMM|nr:hypothetical protein [Stutzerimonas xanthomarina]RRV10872.1 hypothetical protein EGJ28_13490 [Stutzerimonas xanthomarina]